MLEKGNKYPETHSKRRSTDPCLPLPNFHPHQKLPVSSPQTPGVQPESPQVCQEETSGGESVLHLSSGSVEVTLPTTSTPKTPLSSPDHMHAGQHVDVRRTRYRLGSSEQLILHETLSSSAEKNSLKPSLYTSSEPRRTAQDVYHRSSQSATVSREGSFRSLLSSSASSSQPSCVSLREKASQMAHMALDMALMMTPISQEPPSREWYRSNSTFSTTYSARDSDAHSVQSECEEVVNPPSRSHRRRMQQHQVTPPIQSNPGVKQQYSENEVAEFEASDVTSDEDAHDEDEPVDGMETLPVIYRKKKVQKPSIPRRHSAFISDATPREAIPAGNRRFSYSVPDSFKRQSMASDATSEATLTSPKSSDIATGMHR